MKKLLDRIFIDGLGGMAQGLFATLIIGTIIQQIGLFMGGGTGDLIYELGKIAAGLTGAGIGVGVARKLEAGHLVIVSAAVVGMIGAFAGKILSGQVLVDGNLVLAGPGEPLGAFAAAYLAIEIGILISGKTKLDIILTPLVCIGTGSAVGLFVGPPISEFMLWLGSLINWGTEQQPFLMGIVVSVLMGMILTLPISSAALGVILNLSGLAAGAATIGCCCNMIGFAVASWRENKFSGFLAAGNRNVDASDTEYRKKTFDLASGYFVKRRFRSDRNNASSYDEQRYGIGYGNSRTCRSAYDMAGNDAK